MAKLKYFYYPCSTCWSRCRSEQAALLPVEHLLTGKYPNTYNYSPVERTTLSEIHNNMSVQARFDPDEQCFVDQCFFVPLFTS